MSVQINEGVARFNSKYDKPYSDNEEDQPNYLQVVNYLEQHPELLQNPLFKIRSCKAQQCKSADCIFVHRGGVGLAARDVRRWAAIAKAIGTQNRESKPTTPIQKTTPPQIPKTEELNRSPQKPTKPPMTSPKGVEKHDDDRMWDDVKQILAVVGNYPPEEA